MLSSQSIDDVNPNILGREFPVLVTGGTGYMASWLIKYLLEDGYKVRVTVRNIKDEAKYFHLTKISENAKGSLEVYEADLLDQDAFKICMSGCNIVFHTASPYLLSGISNPQKQLIDPSYEGTRNVLEAVNATYSVKKVVFTSAASAVFGDISDMSSTDHMRFDENHWNKSSNLKHQPLGFAKTVAEREAWKIQGEQTRWKLAVLNPALCLGPSLTPYSSSGSLEFIIKLANGTFKSGVPDLQFGLVDVRDVAHAHIFAAQDEYALGRFLLVKEVKSMLEIAKALRKKFGESFPFPSKELSAKTLYFFGFMQGYSRKFVLENVGKDLAFNNVKSKHELGVSYKSVEEAAVEMLQYIMDNNMLK